jgi:cardiolipin synthase
MNWPNLISLCRLLCVPLVVWLFLTDRMIATFIVFLLASISDFLDGLLARILKNQTQIGAYLDPLADKCLLVAVVLLLAMKSQLQLWFVIIVVFRDLLIVVGAILNSILSLNISISPLWISKINTFLQMILVTCILSYNAFGLPSLLLCDYLMYICTFTTIASGACYIVLWIKSIGIRGGS